MPGIVMASNTSSLPITVGRRQGAGHRAGGVQLAASTVKVSHLFRNRWAGAAAEVVGGTAVEVREDTVVVRRGGRPFLTARQTPGDGRTVWLDVERTTAQLGRQTVRDLFKRALVWANGYALYVEYPRSVLLLMDDLWADFGVRSISLRAGGGVSSHSAANNTMRVAAKMGFGVGQAEMLCYLGNDFSVTLEPVSPRLGWKYTDRLPAAEVPWTTACLRRAFGRQA